MALTRRQLKEMELPEETIEKIIAAHAESIEGLKKERDAWREAAAETTAARAERDEMRQRAEEMAVWQEKAAQLQGELDGLHAEKAAEQARAIREEAMRQALLERGANEQALPLLLAAGDLSAVAVTDGEAQGAGEVADMLAQTYPAVFAAPVHIPTGRVAPPSAACMALTTQALAAMSPEEINKNWNAVKTALMKGV